MLTSINLAILLGETPIGYALGQAAKDLGTDQKGTLALAPVVARRSRRT